MPTFSTSVRINSPRERVFAFFTDLRSASQHIKAIDNIEVLTDGPIGKGTRFAETRTMFGRSHTETMTITAFDPPQLYAVTMESCGVRCVTQFTFTQDANATLVEATFTSTPITFMAKLMSFMLIIMKNMCGKVLVRDLADLKATAEGTSENASQPLAA